MAEIELFGMRQSTYVRVAWMTCEEKRAPYIIRHAAPHSETIRALHPFGRIPAMRHGEVVLFESKAIATYIDKIFPGPMLMPQDALGAARAEQWISVVNTTIEPTWTQYFRAYVFPKGSGGQPDRGAIERCLEPMRQQIAVLDKVLETSPFLAGEAMTLADIATLPILHYLHHFPEGEAMATAATHLESYFQRMAARPSAQATVPPPMPSA